MKMKKLGRTDLMVTENSFGALPIQRIDQKSAVELLHMAYDGGINYYDTARAYTDSEEKLGAAFHDRRSSIVISTKSQGKTKQPVLDDLDESLKNLRTDYVDIMQLHNIHSVPDPQDENGLPCRFGGGTETGQMPLHRHHLPPPCHRGGSGQERPLRHHPVPGVPHLPPGGHRPHRPVRQS